MKLQTRKTLGFLLPALLAGSAAAQTTILPGGSNPYVGAPVVLPGPLTGPVSGMKIELPAPRLNPGISVKLSPAPSLAIAAVLPELPMPAIPSRPVVPVFRPNANRENVRHPLAVIVPGLRAQFGASEGKKEKDARRERLERLFDGRPDSGEKDPVVEPGRVVTLPETDLEREIGAY